MTPKIEPVRCVCGWRGLLALRADCRGCGANYTHRVSKERLAVLRAIGAREPGARAVRIEPQMRIWLVDHRLIVASEPPRPAREAPGRQRAPLPRGYRGPGPARAVRCRLRRMGDSSRISGLYCDCAASAADDLDHGIRP